MAKEGSAEAIICDIKRETRRKYCAEEKIRIVIEGPHGEQTITELCRRGVIAESLYYSWTKEFMEAGDMVHSTIDDAGALINKAKVS